MLALGWRLVAGRSGWLASVGSRGRLRLRRSFENDEIFVESVRCTINLQMLDYLWS